MTEGNIDQTQAGSKVKTFPVPFALGEIKENITITTNTTSNTSKEQKGFGGQRKAINKKETNTITKPSKEQIINQAFKFHLQGNILEAAKYYQHFINQGFKDHRVFSNYGLILQNLGNLKEAEISTRKAIQLKPDFGEAHHNLGVILKYLDKLQEAELSARKAIELNPNFAEAHNGLGSVLSDLGNLKEAEISTRKAIQLKPDFVEAHSNLGCILTNIRNLKEAELSIRKAIELNPNFAEAHFNLANTLRDFGNFQEAAISYRKAIQLKPDFAEAHSNLGNVLKNFYGNFYDAINQQKQALKLNIQLAQAKLALIATKANICDWSDEEIYNIWIKSLGIEGKSINPWELFSLEDNPLKHLKRSEKYYKENYFRPAKYLKSSKKNIIHIGYFSADFRRHPVMQLIAPLLELHDKSRFKIYLYSFSLKEDEYTERAKSSGCIFRNITKLNNIEAAELARSDELDIAIDLMGYTRNNRMPIFSYRVAPIQIIYIGFPGSVGSDTIDYIIADNIIIPKENEEFYSEKIIRMPNCFLCNDNKKEISKESILRGDFNLPDQGFIFTCFNNNYKITKKEFNIWMNLLTKKEGSVLWLYKSNQWSVNNLYKEAIKRKVDPDRIIFAEKLPLNKHLARHSLGDLALDTFNMNGGATTSDALWGGLPVLTKIGHSFSARVSASLLNAIGLPELVTYSESEYEEKALYIASNPEEILRLKSKLNKLKETSPLFNSELFTRDLETKYIELVNSHTC